MFAGVGMKNVVVIALCTMLIIVGLKVVFTKKNVPGISPIVQAV